MKKPQLKAPQPPYNKGMLTREQMKDVRGGYITPPSSGTDATYNKCCWDAYPSDCSYCAVGAVCEEKAHSVACSTY